MRKYKLPNELAQLGDDDLKLVNSWLRKYTYPVVQKKCREQFQFDINTNKLCRYYQRLRDVEDLNQQSGQTLTVDDLNKLKSGQPLPDGKVNKQLLDYACFKMAQRPNQTTSELKDIFQIAVHEQNAEFARQRLELANRFADLRDRKQVLKFMELQLKQSSAGLLASPASDPAGSGAPSLVLKNGASPTEVAQTKI